MKKKIAESPIADFFKHFLVKRKGGR